MHSFVTSKNAQWPRLIWPILYVLLIPERHGQTDRQTTYCRITALCASIAR